MKLPSKKLQYIFPQPSCFFSICRPNISETRKRNILLFKIYPANKYHFYETTVHAFINRNKHFIFSHSRATTNLNNPFIYKATSLKITPSPNNTDNSMQNII